MKKIVGSLLASVIVLLSGSFLAAEQPDQKTTPNPAVIFRVFEGIKEGLPAAQSVTSSYLKYTSTFVLKRPQPADIAAEATLKTEQEQIKKTFNLKEVRLLSDSTIAWRRGKTRPGETGRVASGTMFRLDGQLYEVNLGAKDAVEGPFEIFVDEVGDTKARNLLSTSFTMPASGAAVFFGFEDSSGKPYFISLRQMASGAGAGHEAAAAGVGARELQTEDIDKKRREFEEGAVKVQDKIPPPKLVAKVNPVYPEAARKARIQGVVILQARTDVKGRVEDVMVLRSVPELNQAAIEAVKQWVYEPLIIEGQPKEAVFTVTVVFKLNGEKKEGAGTEAAAAKEQVLPKLVTKVNPVYPEAARKAGIQGLVLVEAKIDEKGDVVAAKVVKSVPELDQAALEAVKQWKYEPVVVEGKPTAVVFTVTIKFALQ